MYVRATHDLMIVHVCNLSERSLMVSSAYVKSLALPCKQTLLQGYFTAEFQAEIIGSRHKLNISAFTLSSTRP